MKTLITATIACLAIGTSFAAEKVTYKCVEDDIKTLKLELTFEGKTLNVMKVFNLPFKGVDKELTYTQRDWTKTTNTNLTSASADYRIDISNDTGLGETFLTLTYEIRRNDVNLTLDESLRNTARWIDGSTYGKVRLDFTFEAGFEDQGSTYGFRCTKQRVKTLP